MSFSEEFDRLPLALWRERSLAATELEVRESLSRNHCSAIDFAHLISPSASRLLEDLCQKARLITQQRFGKVMRLFAPLYLSNECVNNCRYCGFARDNNIVRITLSLDEIRREAAQINALGFRNLLLVAGEHPKLVPASYLAQCIRAMHDTFPSVSLEIGPLATSAYRELVEAGADGLTIYQETYNREVYAAMHPAGPKRDFHFRLQTPERAHAAGFRRIGVGALYGLADWPLEALALAAHVRHLQKVCWKSWITISLPRMRPHAGHFDPPSPIPDRELVQLTAALRICFPDAGLVLSTRERAELRDVLMQCGITMMSAGSHTEPGGYTGVGRETAPPARPGFPKIKKAAGSPCSTQASGQFEIADSRSPGEIARQLQRFGYEPVWKDWDAALTT